MFRQTGIIRKPEPRGMEELSKMGLYEKSYKERMEDAKAEVPEGHYSQTRPVTFYTEHLGKKNFYQSPSIGHNPFARTCGMTQIPGNTKAIYAFQGNVNFPREHKVINDFALNTDFTYDNPNLHVDAKQMINFAELKYLIQDMCRGNVHGFSLLRFIFRELDYNKNGKLDPQEFKLGMLRYNIALSETEVSQILKHFDENKDGLISIEEFLETIRIPLKESRRALIDGIIDHYEADSNGKMSLSYIASKFNVKNHPGYLNGVMTLDDCTQEIMRQFPTKKAEDNLTREMLMEYYTDVSAIFEDEQNFQDMLKAMWME